MRSLESFLSEVPFSPIDAISVTTPTSGQNKIYEIWTLAVRLFLAAELNNREKIYALRAE